ncbi:2684_t:CDS:1, partial [Ambispora leptoticha]
LRQLSNKSRSMIEEKISDSINLDLIINSTHIVGLRQTANQINSIICDCLPCSDKNLDIIISKPVDRYNNQIIDNYNDPLKFKHYTNLPDLLTLQEGTRIMYLNNKLFEHGICNRTIRIITKLINEENIEITFPVNDNITKISVEKTTSHFTINGILASKEQYPIQNAFALTVHKTQGLTLPQTTLTIDEDMFADRQVYVAMSRALPGNQ